MLTWDCGLPESPQGRSGLLQVAELISNKDPAGESPNWLFQLRSALEVRE